MTDDTDLVIDDDVVWITDEAGPIAWAVRPGTDDILATVSIPVGARVSVPMGDGTHIALDGSGNILRIELPR